MPHIFKTRVYYEDTDAGGVVYHARYLNFMERARTEFLLALGYKNTTSGIAFIVREAKIEWLFPARLYDQIEVLTSIQFANRLKVIFAHEVRSAANPEIIFCRGEVTVVSINDKMKPCRFSGEMLKRIKEIINSKF